jgi:hypothetical protein
MRGKESAKDRTAQAVRPNARLDADFFLQSFLDFFEQFLALFGFGCQLLF